jgi:hypothetical protein
MFRLHRYYLRRHFLLYLNEYYHLLLLLLMLLQHHRFLPPRVDLPLSKSRQYLHNSCKETTPW